MNPYAASYAETLKQQNNIGIKRQPQYSSNTSINYQNNNNNNNNNNNSNNNNNNNIGNNYSAYATQPYQNIIPLSTPTAASSHPQYNNYQPYTALSTSNIMNPVANIYSQHPYAQNAPQYQTSSYTSAVPYQMNSYQNSKLSYQPNSNMMIYNTNHNQTGYQLQGYQSNTSHTYPMNTFQSTGAINPNDSLLNNAFPSNSVVLYPDPLNAISIQNSKKEIKKYQNLSKYGLNRTSNDNVIAKGTPFKRVNNNTSMNTNTSNAAIASNTSQTNWYCEPCDKDFTQNIAYEAHIATHETCTYSNCTFKATKKVLLAHFSSIHGIYSGTGYKTIDVEGQKFRVLLGTSPDEVKEWRNERKNKFPNSNKIIQKNEQNQAVINAGGILNNNNNNNSKKSKKRKNKNDHDDDKIMNKKISLNNNNSNNNSNNNNLVDNNNKLVNDNNDSINKDLNQSKVENINKLDIKVNQPSEVNQPTTINDNTNSNIFINNNNNIEEKNQSIITIESQSIIIDDQNQTYNDNNKNNNNNKIGKCLAFSRGKCKVGDTCRYRHDFIPIICEYFIKGKCKRGNRCNNIHNKSLKTISNDNSNIDTNISITNNNNNNNNNKLNIPPPLNGGERGTLLKKLLEKEILNEENMILQCLRFIVLNNFLDTL